MGLPELLKLINPQLPEFSFSLTVAKIVFPAFSKKTAGLWGTGSWMAAIMIYLESWLITSP